MNKRTLAVALAAAALTAGRAQAAFVVGYDTSTATSMARAIVTPTVSGDDAANVSGANLARGSGLVASSDTNYNSTGWATSDSLSLAQVGNDYVTFGFTLPAGREASVSEVGAYWDRSSKGPKSMSLLVSTDGFATSTKLFDFTVRDPGSEQTTTPALSGLTGTVEFRYYGYNALESAGTADLEGDEIGPGDSQEFGLYIVGDVADVIAVPEPLAALGGLALLGGVMLTRRRP